MSSSSPIDVHDYLTEDELTQVKSSASLLSSPVGRKIIAHMYYTMFGDHPELRERFSLECFPGLLPLTIDTSIVPEIDRLRDEAPSQPRVITDSILKCLTSLTDLDTLMASIDRACMKHVSRYILPEYYDYMEDAFEKSMIAELGAAEAGKIAAWKKTWNYISRKFILREDQIRADCADMPGGWIGFRPFTATRASPAKPGASSMVVDLVPTDSDPLPSFIPGQWICLKCQLGTLGHVFKNFSIETAQELTPGVVSWRVRVRSDSISGKLLTHYLEPSHPVELSMPLGGFLLQHRSSSAAKSNTSTPTNAHRAPAPLKPRVLPAAHSHHPSRASTFSPLAASLRRDAAAGLRSSSPLEFNPLRCSSPLAGTPVMSPLVRTPVRTPIGGTTPKASPPGTPRGEGPESPRH